MNYSEEYVTDLIDKHLNGALNKEEELLFEEKLKGKEFRRQLTEVQLIQKSIKIYELRRMQRLLQAEEERIKCSQAQSDSGRTPDSPSHYLAIILIVLTQSLSMLFV